MDYSALVDIYVQLGATTRRLEKTQVLAEFLRSIPDHDFDHIFLLLEGRVFPAWDDRHAGVASQLVLKAISLATGVSVSSLEAEWKRSGNLGDVVEVMRQKKRQSSLVCEQLTTRKVFSSLQRLGQIEGKGTVDLKMKIVVDLLTAATPQEAKYIIRTLLEDLRVGLGEGTMRDAIVWAFFSTVLGLSYDKQKNILCLPENTREDYTKHSDVVQLAYDLTNDFGVVAAAAVRGLDALRRVHLVPGNPMQLMLFPKALSIGDAFDSVGMPAAFEFKFDGFRLQVHKVDDKITLFTRRLENVTQQFPDVVTAVSECVKADSFVLDAEVVGCENQRYVAFQKISQRIRRKYDIETVGKEFPVEVNVFDLMHLDGQDVLKEPFAKRRKLLERIVIPIRWKLRLADQIISSKEAEASLFYEKSLAVGNEGIMVKNITASYQPGRRVGYGVKIKPTLETLEVVITGAEWGEGKRSGWLSSFSIAVRDDASGEFVDVGRFGTGLKEKPEEGVSFAEITTLLKPLIVNSTGRLVTVRPEIVVEVDYEEVQRSPTYDSGYALRFPRFVKLRRDRGPKDITTITELQQIYASQRGRSETDLNSTTHI